MPSVVGYPLSDVIKQIDEGLEDIRHPSRHVLRDGIHRVPQPICTPSVRNDPRIMLVPYPPEPGPVAQPGWICVRFHVVRGLGDLELRRGILRQRLIRGILLLYPANGHLPIGVCQAFLLLQSFLVTRRAVVIKGLRRIGGEPHDRAG